MKFTSDKDLAKVKKDDTGFLDAQIIGKILNSKR